MNKFYSGVGSRQTPVDVLEQFQVLGTNLAIAGWTLRSGAAQGADAAFESGVNKVNGYKEIYIPWKGFNGSKSPLFYIDPAAYTLASLVHPNWNACSDAAKKLHARNCYQVLGKDLATPSTFLVCWTQNGELKGGTATAIKLAQMHNVEIFNFGAEGMTIEKVMEFTQNVKN